jgi:hypothetical protein
MKNFLKITAATAALAFGVTGANAELLLHSDPNSDEKVVINTETESEAPVLMSTDGQPPADCPEGTFFLFEDPNDDMKQVVTECVSGTRFIAGEIGEGTMPGQDIPEGALLLSEDPTSDQKEVVSEEEAERRAAPMDQQSQ